jgi:hypothetical protein
MRSAPSAWRQALFYCPKYNKAYQSSTSNITHLNIQEKHTNHGL